MSDTNPHAGETQEHAPCSCVYCTLFRRLDFLEKGIRDGHVPGALLAYLAEVRDAVSGLVEHAASYEGDVYYLLDEVEQASKQYVPRKRLRMAARNVRAGRGSVQVSGGTAP